MNDDHNNKIVDYKSALVYFKKHQKIFPCPPQPPDSSYVLFYRDHLYQFRERYKNMEPFQLDGLLQEHWKCLPIEQKQKYKEQYHHELLKYKKEFKRFLDRYVVQHMMISQKKENDNKEKTTTVQHHLNDPNNEKNNNGIKTNTILNQEVIVNNNNDIICNLLNDDKENRITYSSFLDNREFSIFDSNEILYAEKMDYHQEQQKKQTKK